MTRPPRPLSERRPRRPSINAEQLASLSHEFRTPLNGVIGMARLMEGTRLTAEQRAYAASIRESGEHLLTLVNDVMDFARLGAGQLALRTGPVQVEWLLRGVCELLAPRAAEKGLEIAWAAPLALGEIEADEGRLRQILLNFAGNAVKFTPAGGVLVSAVPAQPGRVRFMVEDTGPGVPGEVRERIFEAFVQAEPSDAKLGGAGLGLAIVRRLADAMAGQAGVEPRPGGGALFWFEAGLKVHSAADPELSLAGLRIGVASPNPMLREAARRQVEGCGGEAVVAGELGAALTGTRPGDALLLDHALAAPGRRLRRPPERAAIVLLAPKERQCIPAYRDAGFAGYLIKPLRRSSLAERVRIAIEAADPASAPEDERIAAVAAPGARVLLVEDDPINALLARALLAREGCAVEHAPSGEEALAAVAVSNFDLVLMDMRMPGLSGEASARALRRQGITAPIIALTANAFVEDRHACLAAGMDDVLVKPLSPDALRAMLTRWLGRGWTQPASHAKLA